MGLFEIFRRSEQPPEAIAEGERVLNERGCDSLRRNSSASLVFLVCDRRRGHPGPCVFEARPGLAATAPTRESSVLQERAEDVGAITDGLYAGAEGVFEPWRRGEIERRHYARLFAFQRWRAETGRMRAGGVWL